MPSDSLTLFLSGDITLEQFPEAVMEWRRLISMLTDDVAAGSQITWLIDDLRPGSALITVRGQSPAVEAESLIQEVTRAYIAVGRALERRAPVPYPGPIAQQASRLQGLVNGGIESIRLSTDEEDAIIPSLAVVISDEQREAATAGSYGAIEGHIDTLGRRKGLHFTLYDSIHDRAVSCYVSPDIEEILRGIWGKYALVEGWIRRDPVTGRAQTVRRIRQITPLPDREEVGEFRQARGVVNLGGEKPEDIVSRIRDAW